MSLEGLDTAPVLEAFEYAQAEPGAWFWINYTSRDEVELLTKGSNGAEEMRAVAVKYQPDDSPLYGFIRFRRRSVLVKLIPDGTSRVLKARSQVHFQLIGERFTHDTTFTITSPRELTDSGLEKNSACSTHTQTASISSSNSSLRQRRLADIAESADEGEESSSLRNGYNYKEGAEVRQGLAVVVTTHDAVVSVITTGGGRGGGGDVGGGGPLLGVPLPLPLPPGQQREDDRDVAATAAFLEPSSFSSSSNYNKSPFDSNSIEEPRRKSTSSARPSLSSDIYNYYPYVPKVKLGPRPHVGDVPKRPHTSNEPSKTFQASAEELRASVPRSVHIPPRRSGLPSRIKPSITTSPALDIPHPPQSPVIPTTPTSVVSLPIPSLLHSPPSHAKSHSADGGPAALTPEKQRLMRALQLRRKNQLAAEQKKREEEKARTEQEIEPYPENTKQTSSTTESSDTDASGEEEITPTAYTMHTNFEDIIQTPTDKENKLDVLVDNKAESLLSQDLETASESCTSCTTPTTVEISVLKQNDNDTPQVETQASDDMEDVKKEQGSIDEQLKVEGSVEGSQSPTEEDTPVEPEPTPLPIVEEPSAKLSEPSVEKVESITKVRDDVNLEDDNDTESVRSMAISVKSEQLMPAIRPDRSKFSKSVHIPEETKIDSGPPTPTFGRRLERISTIPQSETPVIEAARSVSAPFLKTARVQEQNPKPVTTRKVNVAGGSVSQRIKQFQQLAGAPKATFIPPLTPSRSRSNSPTPGWAEKSNTQKTPPSIFRRASVSSGLERSPNSSPSDCASARPMTSVPLENTAKFEVVTKDDKPQLQVTTKIPREQEKFTPSPQLSTMLPPRAPTPESLTPVAVPMTVPLPMAPPPAPAPATVEKPAPAPAIPTLRRRSVDISAVVEKMVARKTSIEQETRAVRASMDEKRPEVVEKKERPRLFSRASSKDKEEKKALALLTEGAVANTKSATSTPTTETSSAGGFLKRVSSTLSRKKDSPSPPRQPTPPPVEDIRTYLLAGWINVQLPDTMLWRRRCMKIDSRKWLFLSLTDDETAPQTRKYYIPSEVCKVDLPDVDEQELPHSVRLMLQEGGVLQCACQNSREQKEVLNVIRGCLS